MISCAEPSSPSVPRAPLGEAGVAVVECRHQPGFVAEMRDDFAKFLVPIDGESMWEAGGRQHWMLPGMVVHVAAHTWHRPCDLSGKLATGYALHYRAGCLPADLERELSLEAASPLRLFRPGTGTVRRLHALVREMRVEQEARRLGWEAVLCARLTDVAVLALRGDPADRPPAGWGDESWYRVHEYVARLPAAFHGTGSLDDAARSVGLGRRRFTELFREIAGESWRRRVQRLRLEQACRLLEATQWSVTAIAFECGFEELSHFHHCFKTAHGITPREYRARRCSAEDAGAAAGDRSAHPAARPWPSAQPSRNGGFNSA
jgi:AraC-like DNA-binding protein